MAINREKIEKLVNKIQYDNSSATSTGKIESDFENFDADKFFYKTLNKDIILDEKNGKKVGKNSVAVMHFARGPVDGFRTLGTFNKQGEYVIDHAITEELIEMTKVRSRHNINNMSDNASAASAKGQGQFSGNANSLMDDKHRKITEYQGIVFYREFGELRFAVRIVDMYTNNIIVQKRATLSVLEQIDKVNGMINNTLMTDIAVYNQIGDLGNFEKNYKAAFNIIGGAYQEPGQEDSDQWFLMGAPLLDNKNNYPHINLLRKYQSAIKFFSAAEIEKSEKELFEKRKKLLAKSGPAGQKILQELEEMYKIGNRFLRRDSGDYFAASNDVIDALIDSLAVANPEQAEEILRVLDSTKKATTKVQDAAIEKAKGKLKKEFEEDALGRYKKGETMAFQKFGKGLEELTDAEWKELEEELKKIEDLEKKKKQGQDLFALNNFTLGDKKIPVLKVEGKAPVEGISAIEEIKEILATKRAKEKGVPVDEKGKFIKPVAKEEPTLEEKKTKLEKDILAAEPAMTEFEKIMKKAAEARAAEEEKKAAKKGKPIAKGTQIVEQPTAAASSIIAEAEAAPGDAKPKGKPVLKPAVVVDAKGNVVTVEAPKKDVKGAAPVIEGNIIAEEVKPKKVVKGTTPVVEEERTATDKPKTPVNTDGKKGIAPVVDPEAEKKGRMRNPALEELLRQSQTIGRESQPVTDPKVKGQIDVLTTDNKKLKEQVTILTQENAIYKKTATVQPVTDGSSGGGGTSRTRFTATHTSSPVQPVVDKQTVSTTQTNSSQTMTRDTDFSSSLLYEPVYETNHVEPLSEAAQAAIYGADYKFEVKKKDGTVEKYIITISEAPTKTVVKPVVKETN